MNIEIIKSAIVEREEELKEKFKKEKIIKREAEVIVNKFPARDISLIITGIRRCGKSIFAFMLGEGKKFGYVNFEDERLTVDAKELNKVLEAVYSLKGEVDTLIFDEIQYVEGWEKFIARLLPNKKIIITGSNARLLSKELATFLTGRHIDFTLFPFSFKEFLDWKGFKPNIYLTRDVAKIKDFLREYLEKGGFPLRYNLGEIFLVENYKDIIERDIVQRYKIKYIKVLKELASYLITNICNEISYNRLRKIFKLKSVHTVENYFTYLENAYLVFSLKRFSFKLKEQIKAPRKVYCIDNGLVNAIGFRFSEDKGRFMENLVAVEILRRSTFNNWEVYYWKDHQEREVDFVIKKRRNPIGLIQVSNINSLNEIKDREVNSLIKASSELKCNNLLLITADYEGEEKYKGRLIKFIPLWKWLLHDKIMNELQRKSN